MEMKREKEWGKRVNEEEKQIEIHRMKREMIQ